MLLSTPVCDFGWQAPDFKLQDPDGIEHTMSGHLGGKGILIAFICNHCPYVQEIAARLAEDSQTLIDEGIGVLAVMSNDYSSVPEDSPASMKRFAARFGFPFPYLIDEDQSVARNFGAICTPEFFGLNKEGRLQFRGRLDDAGLGGQTDRKRELVEAMRQIAETGNGPREQTASMGCSIKWKHRRG